MIKIEEELKKLLLRRIKSLNEFIREMEDFSKTCNIKVDDEKIYIAACAQRKILRELVGGTFKDKD